VNGCGAGVLGMWADLLQVSLRENIRDPNGGMMAEKGTKKGGQELPSDVQDRPEQNAGYDEAVRGGAAGEELDEEGLAVPLADEREIETDDPDERAARAAAAEVRQRERSAR
jgi:hypothetical protein